MRKKKKKKSQVFAPVPITTMSYWNSTVQQRRRTPCSNPNYVDFRLFFFWTDGKFGKLVQSEIRLSFTETYQQAQEQLWSPTFQTFPQEIQEFSV